MAYNISRYSTRDVIRTDSEDYVKQLSSRNVPFIEHFSTAQLTYPPDEFLAALDVSNEYWGVGMRFYKLANKYYGDASLWWVIPWFNQVPLESDFSAGDLVMVPRPLEAILNFFRQAG